MSEADFCGMDAGEYYATKDFRDRERFYREQELEEQMKNRMTVRHGMLTDLETYLKQSGWKLEEPVGTYEVLRARNQNYPRPLLVYDRAERGIGYSIDERDLKVYNGWRKNRKRRGLDPDWPTETERKAYWEGRIK